MKTLITLNLILTLTLTSCHPIVLTTTVYRNVGPEVPVYVDRPVYVIPPTVYIIKDTCLTK